MNILLKEITIRDLVAGYKDTGDDGVVGYHGKLDIRPAYQREYVYKEKERNAVIDTVLKGFPLNVMYWVVKQCIKDNNANANGDCADNTDSNGVNNNDTYELLDGQQRSISICSYVDGDFSLNGLYFHNLPKNKQNDILNYKLMVYLCDGTDSEKLEWFKTINIAGLKLTDQELRNSIYTGPWLSDAKSYFSKSNCPAQALASQYLVGVPNRQEYLERALCWISNDDIEAYMAKHQHDADADALRQYFLKVINWVNSNFTCYRKEMKGLDWGRFYNDYHTNKYNAKNMESDIKTLILDDEVTSKKGIYEYLLSSKKLDRCLSLRAFTEKDKTEAFERQKKAGSSQATCPKCNDDTKLYDIGEMEADHIVAWSKGGKTISSNCQMLCKFHNGTKSNS